MEINDMTREDKVRQFREAAGKGTYSDSDESEADLVFTCIQEEFSEFLEASLDFEENDTGTTRASLVKEWADLQYVVSQAAVFYRIPADAAFNRVHLSNMSKVVDGKIIFRDDGKIMKPEGYEAPDMKGL